MALVGLVIGLSVHFFLKVAFGASGNMQVHFYRSMLRQKQRNPHLSPIAMGL